eukprot:m.106005 g.106005  ORF g.106005 m.106005 type:complete len:69 (-) comp16889_c0_seq2:904-1110(-)
MEALERGAVHTIVVWEDLPVKRVVVQEDNAGSGGQKHDPAIPRVRYTTVPTRAALYLCRHRCCAGKEW